MPSALPLSVIEPNDVITFAVIEAVEIQDTDVDALPKPVIGFAPVQLSGKHLAQIEQDPGIPEGKKVYLHFEIHLCPVHHLYEDIQNPKFFILRAARQFGGQNLCFLYFRWRKVQQGGDKAGVHLRVQFLS